VPDNIKELVDVTLEEFEYKKKENWTFLPQKPLTA
jgi:hypothetical protein